MVAYIDISTICTMSWDNLGVCCVKHAGVWSSTQEWEAGGVTLTSSSSVVSFSSEGRLSAVRRLYLPIAVVLFFLLFGDFPGMKWEEGATDILNISDYMKFDILNISLIFLISVTI